LEEVLNKKSASDITTSKIAKQNRTTLKRIPASKARVVKKSNRTQQVPEEVSFWCSFFFFRFIKIFFSFAIKLMKEVQLFLFF